MTIFINRSIPLSQESRDGWTTAGTVLLSRHERRRRRQLDVATENDTLVNLGLGEVVPFDGRVYNDFASIRAVITPAALRRTMPDLIPPKPQPIDAFWFKGPGQHGDNKTFHPEGIVGFRPGNRNVEQGWDTQLHIEGTEYRIITVGDKVVQAYKKMEPILGVRQWAWIGVGGIKKYGIIPLVKAAVALVPKGDLSVFGWDCIVSADAAYIIEGNSSPGVGAETAQRIVKAIGAAGPAA